MITFDSKFAHEDNKSYFPVTKDKMNEKTKHNTEEL